MRLSLDLAQLDSKESAGNRACKLQAKTNASVSGRIVALPASDLEANAQAAERTMNLIKLDDEKIWRPYDEMAALNRLGSI